MKVLLVGYEPTHATLLQEKKDQLESEGQSAVVVCLDLELEWILEQAGVRVLSLLGKVFSERADNLERAETIALDIRKRYLSNTYRGVSIDTILGFSLQTFIQKWFYYMELFFSILDQKNPSTIYICAPRFSPAKEENTLLFYNHQAPIIVLKQICESRGITFKVISTPAMRQQKNFSVLGWGRELVLFIGNAIMEWATPVAYKRILASEYWRHIATLFDELPNSSLILYDRQEFRNIPWKTIIRHRIQFRHPPSVLKNTASALLRAEEICSRWTDNEERFLNEPWTYGGQALTLTLRSLLSDVLKHQLLGFLSQIDSMHEWIDSLRPNIVLLRAVVSAQPHFPILSQVAHVHRIPAIELQHGLELFASGSISRIHTVEHMAVYGRIIMQEMNRVAPGPRLSVIGSLDFDLLHSNTIREQTHERKKILCVAPDIYFPAAFDTFDAFKYFSAVAQAIAADKSRVSIKLRSASDGRQSFFREAVKRAFDGCVYETIEGGTMLSACKGVSIAISCFSTASLEILQSGIPIIFAALSPADSRFIPFHFAPYEREGAVKIAQTAEELCKTVKKVQSDAVSHQNMERAAVRFMKTNYAFDGHAAQRLAAYIESITNHG